MGRRMYRWTVQKQSCLRIRNRRKDILQTAGLSAFTDGAEEEPELFSADEDESSSGTEEGTEGLEYEYIEETDSYRVVKGVDAERVDIPSSYQGKYVTEIGEEAFAGCKNLKGVYIDNRYGTVTIRERAFENCTSLEWVVSREVLL